MTRFTGRRLSLTRCFHVSLLDGSLLQGLGKPLCLQNSRLKHYPTWQPVTSSQKGKQLSHLDQPPPPVTQICTNALMSAGQCQIHQLVRGETLETMLLVWSPMQGGIYRFSQSVSETWYSSKDSSHAQSTFTLMDCRTWHETLRLVNTNTTQLSSLSGTWLSEQLFRYCTTLSAIEMSETAR